ncbi:MAG: hypothetical protein AB8B67_01400 [Rickettsiaceae bacterium]
MILQISEISLSPMVITFKRIWTLKNSELIPEDLYDVALYKKRNIIERFFSRLKEK